MNGLTMRQVMMLALFFRFYDYEFLLNWKLQLVDVMNGILSKDHKELSQKNIFSNPLLSTLFLNNDNVTVSENDTVVKMISDIMFSNDYNIKYSQFTVIRKKVQETLGTKGSIFFQFLNFLNFVFNDFFKDGNITNSILKTKDDKILLIHILLNIYKIMLIFPDHIKVHSGKDVISAITTKMKGRLLANKETDYLKGDYDNSRLSDFTSGDKNLVFITSIDSYYYIYKKYNISDKNMYCIFEIYDYVENLYEKKTQPENINNFLNELLKILNTICKNSFNIDIKNMFSDT